MKSGQCSIDRKLGIDLIRIVAMLLITATHYIGYSGLLESNDILPVNNVLFTWISILARAALNLFAMITGYLMCKKSFSFMRIIRLWFDVMVVSLLGLIFSMLMGGMPGRGVLFKSLLPVSTFSYWYINTHILLLCVSPLLNMLIRAISPSTHLKMCCLLTAICCVFLEMNPFVNAEIYIGHGHGIVWFSILYLWGGCFARGEITFSKRVAIAAGGMPQLFLMIVSFLQERIFVLSRLNLFSMNSLFMVVIALSAFLLLRDISLKGKLGTFLNSMAGASLFVYLLQEHNALRDAFWGLFHTIKLVGSYYIWIDFVLALLCLWPAAYLVKRVTVRVWPLFAKTIRLFGTNFLK